MRNVSPEDLSSDAVAKLRKYTSNQWRETRLPIGEFNGSSWLLPKNISGGDIRSIGIVAFGRDHVADISVREVGFF